jgi:hypothetical protein
MQRREGEDSGQRGQRQSGSEGAAGSDQLMAPKRKPFANVKRQFWQWPPAAASQMNRTLREVRRAI